MVDRLNKTMGQVIILEPSVKTLDFEDGKLDPEFDRGGLHALMGRSPPSKKASKDET